MKVTFDTNTLDRAVRPERFPKDPRQPVYLKVHAALRRGSIQGFFCETLVIIEGIQKKDRVATLGSTALQSERQPETMTPAGTTAIPITLKVEQQRQPLHPEMVARLNATLDLGFQVLGAPRIGQPRIVDLEGNIYVKEPDEATLAKRLERYHEAGEAIEKRGLGADQIRTLAKGFADRDKIHEAWFKSLVRARDIHEINAVARACGEWADGDSIATHIGYGNDLFCTEDKGKSAGAASVLDATNRAWVEETFGVKFVNLSELADLA